MNNIRIFIKVTLFMVGLTVSAQSIDSVQLDLKNLSEISFHKKYSSYEDVIFKEDIQVTRKVWSLKQLRDVHIMLSQKGIPTLTQIVERPSEESPYYIISHYHLPTSDLLSRIASYRIDLVHGTIDYQNLEDFIKDEWKRIK